MKKQITTSILALSLSLVATAADLSERAPYKEKIDSLVQLNTKASFTYDEHGNNTLRSYYRKVGDNWTEQQRLHYVYDSKNRLIETWLSELNSGTWRPTTNKEVITYNSQNQQHSYAEYDWDTTSNQWIPIKKYEYEYENGDTTIRYRYGVSQTTNDWDLNFKKEFTYDSNRKLLTTKESQQKGTDWVTSTDYAYSYDSKGRVSEEIYSRWQLLTPKPYSRTTYEYDNNDSVIEKVSYGRSGVEWIYHSKISSTYNSAGSKISAEIAYFTDGAWAPYGKEEQSYDDNQNCISVTHFDYTDGWIPSSKVIRTYDLSSAAKNILYPYMESYTNKVLTEEFTFWDNTKEEWYGNNLSTFYYSPLITPVISHNNIASEVGITTIQRGNTLSVSLTTNDKSVMKLYSLNGKLLHQASFVNEMNFNLSALASGIYVGTIQNNSMTHNFKVERK